MLAVSYNNSEKDPFFGDDQTHKVTINVQTNT